MKTIKIHVNKDGSKVKIGVEGSPGHACKDLTESLEKAIFGGGGASSVEFTEEYHQEPSLGVDHTL